MNKFLKKQQILQRKAREVMKYMNLIKILQFYGKKEFVGSFALGLMAWRDIDIDLTVNKPKNIENIFWKLAKKFSKLKGTRLILLANNLNGKTEENRPKSMYIGLKFGYKEKIWKFDIRLLKQFNPKLKEYKNSLKKKLNKKKRIIILKIKNKYMNHPDYSKKFGGFHIYRAVLDFGIKDNEEFRRYLEKEVYR